MKQDRAVLQNHGNKVCHTQGRDNSFCSYLNFCLLYTSIKEPEANAKFEVRLKSTGVLYDTITTDKNGYAKTKPLPYGIYEVKQVSGKEGYKFVAPFEVTAVSYTHLV